MSQTHEREIRLQKNDKLLFERLCQVGCLTSKQVTNLVFKNSSRRYTRERLKQLTDHGYLRRTNRKEAMATSIYFANPKRIESKVNSELLDRACLAENSRPWYGRYIEHDDLVRDYALLILETFPCIDVFVDFQLSAGFGSSSSTFESGKRKVPDIAVTLQNGTTIFIEVELSTKSASRYNDVFARYLLHNKFAVIYFYENESTLQKIVKTQEECGLKGCGVEFPILFWPINKPLERSELNTLFDLAQTKMKTWQRSQEIPDVHLGNKPLNLSELLK